MVPDQQPCQPSSQQPATDSSSTSSSVNEPTDDAIEDNNADSSVERDSSTEDDEPAAAAAAAAAHQQEDDDDNDNDDEDDDESMMMIPRVLVKSIAAQALALTVQEWTQMGQNTEDPTISETAMFGDDLMTAVNRVASLLLVRIVALQYHRVGRNHHHNSSNYYDEEELSTSSICRHALLSEDHPWPFLTKTLYTQLHQYVQSILLGYANHLPFHNPQHAATVVISCNKLIDLALTGTHSCYGLRENPLLLVAVLLAALIHDVKHQGVKNGQLALENDTLALLYNDRSIQEKNSLHFAFAEFLKTDYIELRQFLFGNDDAQYRYFRNTVVSAVMATDLACPEQTALTRSKWKEAFADKPNLVLSRRGIIAPSIAGRQRRGSGKFRRGSNCSEVSELTFDLPSSSTRPAQHQPPLQSPVDAPRPRRNSTSSPSRRRLSSESSNYATQRWAVLKQQQQHQRRKSSDGDDSTCDDEYATDSVVLMMQKKPKVAAAVTSDDRRYSVDTKESIASSSFLSVAAESIGIHRKRMDGGTEPTRRQSRLALAAAEHTGQPPKFETSGDDDSSGSVTSSDEEQEYGGTTVSGMQRMVADRQRRSESAANNAAGSYRKRLGIRRSIDFSGEAIEVYSRRNSLGGVSALSGEHNELEETSIQNNEGLDYLRATAVLELLIRAADVGHFLQGRDNMTQWSARMYFELQRAHQCGRGPNPTPDWFDNQIKVIDLYLRPLAYQLDECGVFGDLAGAMFAEIIDDVAAHWLLYGKEFTAELMQIDPSESSFLPTESSGDTTNTNSEPEITAIREVSSAPQLHPR
jgi:3'5'-cyclic nucleotide phosphodiesterase